MKTTKIVLVGLIALSAACTAIKPETTVPDNLVTREFTAALDTPQTKTHLDGTNVLWDASGESIAIIDSDGLTYTLEQTSVSDDYKKATFAGDVPGTGCILAVYPAIDGSDYEDGMLTLEIPAQQDAVENSFASGNNAAISKVSGDDRLYFKNIGGLLGFTVNADDITSIRFSATETSGGTLTGPVLVGFDGEDPDCISDAASGNAYVELTGSIQSGKRYFAIVAPGTYEDLQVVFTTSAGRTATFTKDATLTVERSKALSISAFTIGEQDWDDYVSGGTAMLTYSEVHEAGKASGYGSPQSYTNDYGTWNICAVDNNTDKGLQVREGKVSYIGTPEFDGTITSIQITNNNTRSGDYYVCLQSGGTNVSGTYLSKSVVGKSTITIDVSSLNARKLYIRAGFVAVISAISVEWSGGGGNQTTPTVTTLDADSIGMADATLYASFSGIPTSPSAVAAFFRWGTSASSLTNEAYDNDFPTSTESGSFSAQLTGLTEETVYYYQAVMTLGDGSDVEGEIKSFATRSSQQTNDLGYLNCYEVPAVEVNGSMVSGNEADGRGYRWYRFQTTNSKRRIATHTFNDSGKPFRNYTVMVDQDRQAPVWDAFIMHKTVFFDSDLGRGSWTTDPAFPASWQNSETLGDYHKGHLVASNFRQNYTSARNQTFYYSNQAPQYQTTFNDGVWNNMENRMVSVAPTGRDTLYVTCGVLYEGKFDSNNKFVAGELQYISGVPIPSHFYCCLMLCSFNTSGTMTGAHGSAYIMENRPYNTKSEKYTDFTYKIDDVETRAGLDFFHNVPDAFENTAEAERYAILAAPTNN